MKPSILFVDDEPNVLDGLRDSLRSRRHELRTVFAHGGDEALRHIADAPFDVVVSDMRMPGMDGADLLARVRELVPEAVRVILSGQASEEAALRMVPVAHLSMAKPCTGENLSNMLDRACAVRHMLADPDLRACVHRIGALPSPPDVGRRLLRDIGNDDLSMQALARIVEGDVALAAKVLQVVNSGFFGLPHEISDLQRAITLLGTDLLQTLALSHGALREFHPSKALRGFSLARLEEHSHAVAVVAQSLCRPGADARTAASAGLLHDAGQLVLASRMPEQFSEALALVKGEGVPVHEAETAVFGVSHPAVGAYLLALWGVPERIVDAVGGHHLPPEPTDTPRPLTPSQAVRVAVHATDHAQHPQESHLGATTAREVLGAVAPMEVVEIWLKVASPETVDVVARG